MKRIILAGILVLALGTTSSFVGAQEPVGVDICFESAVDVFLEIRENSWYGTIGSHVTYAVAPGCFSHLADQTIHVRTFRTGYRGWENTIEVVPDMPPIYIPTEPDPRYETIIEAAAPYPVRAGFGGFVVHLPDESWAIYHLDTATLEPLDDSPYVLYPRLPEAQLLALDVARLPSGGYETVYPSPSGRQVAFPRTGPDGLRLWVANLDSLAAIDTAIIINSDSDATYGGFPGSAVFWLSEDSLVVQADDPPDYTDLPFATLVTLQGSAISVAPLSDVKPWAEPRHIWPEVGEVSRILAVSPSGRHILAWTVSSHCLLWNGDTGSFRVLGRNSRPVAAWHTDDRLRSTCGGQLTDYSVAFEQYWSMLLDSYELADLNLGSSIEAFSLDGAAIAIFRGRIGDILGPTQMVRRLPYD